MWTTCSLGDGFDFQDEAWNMDCGLRNQHRVSSLVITLFRMSCLLFTLPILFPWKRNWSSHRSSAIFQGTRCYTWLTAQHISNEVATLSIVNLQSSQMIFLNMGSNLLRAAIAGLSFHVLIAPDCWLPLEHPYNFYTAGLLMALYS
jgi:hypothetical protein